MPDDVDNDDALFELAAGLPPRKRGDDEPTAVNNEENPPDDTQIELDYCKSMSADQIFCISNLDNADMNVKADANNKWLIDPDNGDGFALMYGCVRATFGIRLPQASTSEWQPAVSSVPTLPIIIYQVRIVDFMVRFVFLVAPKTRRLCTLQSLKHVPFEEHEPYDMRVGWSAGTGGAPVGEADKSYCYSRMGRKAAANVFSDYGQPMTQTDVVTVALVSARSADTTRLIFFRTQKQKRFDST